MTWRKKIIKPKLTDTEQLMKSQFKFSGKLKKVKTKSGWIMKVRQQGNQIGDYLSKKSVDDVLKFVSGKDKLEIR